MSYSKVFKQTLTLLFTAALLASGLGTAQAALTHDLLITPNEGSFGGTILHVQVHDFRHIK